MSQENRVTPHPTPRNARPGGIKDGVDYQELGPDYLDKLQPRRLTRYLVKRLESLGHKVTLAPVDKAA